MQFVKKISRFECITAIKWVFSGLARRKNIERQTKRSAPRGACKEFM